MTSNAPLVLASGSPRRADILTTLGIRFEVRKSGVDEKALGAPDHAAFVRTVATAKLEQVLAALKGETRFVLAADTMVCVDDQRLGQPADDTDAHRMLLRLSGREHVVKTAIALGRGHETLACEVVSTTVSFRATTAEELRRYIATGEGRDKAGSYAIQGIGSGFVERIDGSYTNVVGLPAAEVVGLLVRHGALTKWP
ncbi:MAG: Maf family protein [Myxococcota bacterium]